MVQSALLIKEKSRITTLEYFRLNAIFALQILRQKQLKDENMNYLKSLFIGVSAIILFSNADCNKKIQVGHDIEGKSITIASPTLGVGAFDITENFKFNLDSILSQYNLTLDNLISIKPLSAKVTIMDNDSIPVTFDIIDYIKVELSSATLPSQQIAHKDPIPHIGLTELSPDIDSNSDITAFTKASEVTYHFKGFLNKAITHAIQFKFDIKWHIIGQI